MTCYHDKVIYITGAGSGMGLLAARKLAALGARLALFERQLQAATLAAVEAERPTPGAPFRQYRLDVAERAQVLETMARAAAEVGPPDIVINMAGIGGVGEFADMPFERFDRMIQTNLYGSRHVCEAVLPLLRPGASIVLAGSMAGMVPVYGYTAYGTSKFAVLGFAQCLRYELKPRGIAVTCFCPGEVATPGLAKERQATHPATTALKKLGGTMAAEDAVNALLHGIARRRFMITPGWKTSFTYWALRLTPMVLWHAITDRLVAGAIKGR